jgi:hypothetical protein
MGGKRQAMIRFAFRIVGVLLLAVALGLLSYDGVRSMVGGTAFTSVGSIWENIPQNARAALQSAVERLADLLQSYFLKQPVWLALAIIGALLILIGQRMKPRIGRR